MGRILVIDDDPEVLQLVARMLRESGHEVCEAAFPAAAIQFCSQHERAVDLVVSDFELPGLNGLQLADRLRRIRPELKFVFMSGSVSACERLAEDGRIFLPKPFLLEELLQAVEENIHMP